MDRINYIVVFLEGIFSFLSPCILPILPVYLAILSKSVQQNEKSQRSALLKNTFLFILGISTTFFILGTGISIFRVFLNTYMKWILIVGGLIIVVFGLFSIGDLNIPFLQKERRFHYQVKEMKPWTAYLLGFTFSFGWTPCVGPMLASVLVLASTQNALEGNLLLLLYTLGFTVPFLLIALFSEKMIQLLEYLKKHVEKIQKFGGFLIMMMGLLMFAKGVTTPNYIQPSHEQQSTEEHKEALMAPDFTKQDQYGNEHTLSDYRGKVVVINFWATWCSPCRAELPDIQEVYEEYGSNQEDVIILGITFPDMDKEQSKQGILDFIETQGYTFPTLFDESMELAYQYYINAFPTTFFINKDGTVEGYANGMLTKETIQELIEKLR